MDMTVKQCIECLHDRDMLSECNYAALIEAVDDYHEAYARITNCKSKYLIGEKVYVEKNRLRQPTGKNLQGLYPDRTARSHRHHRHSGSHAAAGTFRSS